MKLVVLIALVALALINWPRFAEAQYYRRCHEPNAPHIVSGLYAEDYQMESGRNEVQDFLNQVAEYQECLQRNYKEASQHADDVISEWNEAVRSYNSRY